MKRILAVDDNDDIRLMLEKFLEYSGYECDTASCGEDGLSLFRKRPYDLLLLDAAMPDLTGFEVAAKVRETSKVPILILTGHAGPLNEAHAQSVGANKVLYKPIDPPKLASEIEALLGKV